MDENTYESPRETKDDAYVQPHIVEKASPMMKRGATTLGCFLGGCLFPLVFPFLAALVLAVISVFIKFPDEYSGYPDGPFAIIGWFLYWVILIPIGAILGGIIECGIRKIVARTRQRKPSEPHNG
jgi:hypothetical protein